MQTRRNALEECRKIGETVLAAEIMGVGEAFVDYGYLRGEDDDDDEISHAMMIVINAMSEEERRFIRLEWRPDGAGLFWDALHKVADVMKGCDYFGGLNKVRRALSKAAGVDFDEEAGETESELGSESD